MNIKKISGDLSRGQGHRLPSSSADSVGRDRESVGNQSGPLTSSGRETVSPITANTSANTRDATTADKSVEYSLPDSSFAERRATSAGEDSSSTPVLPGVKKEKVRQRIGQVHLVQCSEPIKEGQCVRTLCGNTIADAVPVAFVGGDFQIELVDIENLAGVCWGCKHAETLTGRYVYGVRSRKEIRQENQQEK